MVTSRCLKRNVIRILKDESNRKSHIEKMSNGLNRSWLLWLNPQSTSDAGCANKLTFGGSSCPSVLTTTKRAG